MKKFIPIALAVLVALLGGGALYACLSGSALRPDERGKATPAKPLSYLDIGKTMVLLRAAPGETGSRYAVVEAVLEVDEKALGKVRQEMLPMRSLVFRTVAAYTADELRMLKVDEITAAIEATIRAHEKAVGTRLAIERVMLTSLVIE